MEKGLLSVVITTYHREFELLRESIDSVLAQTYSNLELLICDDNGADNTYSDAIEKGLRENYPAVKYIKMSRNSGACAARNAGIMESRGEFVAFLDDDDLWERTKAEKQLKLFEDKNVGVAFCRGYVFNDNNLNELSPYYTSRHFLPNPVFDDFIVQDRVGSTSQVIIRKECFYTCDMFDAKMQARQDYEMWIRLSKNKIGFAGVDEPLFYHRLHGGDQITKVPLRALNGNLRMLGKYKSDFKKNKYARFNIYTTISGLGGRCGKTGIRLSFGIKAFFARPLYLITSVIQGK